MDQFNAMRCFRDVVELGGFSAAARRRGLAPSSISRQVEQLERQLGCRLLTRSTRQISLTEAGEYYYHHACRILEEMEQAAGRLSDFQSRPGGTLHLDAAAPFGRRYIAPLLPEFHSRHPEIRVELRLNDRVVDLVSEQTDLAIRVGRLEDSQLIARQLMPSRLTVCASPAYFERRGKPSGPTELPQHDCLQYSRPDAAPAWHIAGKRLTVSGPASSNDVECLLLWARAGLGLVNLPDWVVAADIANGALEKAFVDEEEEGAGVYAVYKERVFTPAKTKLFLEFLQERIPGHLAA
jgi:DNA-binding transcriptional LysR family regulator